MNVEIIFLLVIIIMLIDVLKNIINIIKKNAKPLGYSTEIR